MKVLITGKNSQVGTDLAKSVPGNIDLYTFNRNELDITSAQEVTSKLDEIKPDFIINTAGIYGS